MLSLMSRKLLTTMSYLSILLLALFFSGSKNSANQDKIFTFGYGTLKNISNSYPLPTQNGQKVFDSTLQFQPMQKAFNFRGGISALYTQNGTFMIGGGISRTLTFHNIEFNMLLHPSLIYINGNDKQRISFPINFRSTAGISYYITKQISIGFEILHISNSTVSHPNSGLDSLKFNIGYRF